MRHTIMTVSLLFVASALGTAQADTMKIPGPPPADGSDKELKECRAALTSSQEDVDTLVPALARCEGKTEDQVRSDYGIGSGTTVKVVKRDPPRKPHKPHKPKSPPKAPEVKQGPQGPAGPQGPVGPQGDRGADGRSSRIKVTAEGPGKNCPSGGSHLMIGIDLDGLNGLDESEIETDIYVCNGAAGKSGNDGRDGYSRIQLIGGMRFASIFTADRPNGWSVAPELGIKYWLSQTVEFNLGLAWAPGDDRNMVVSGQVCRRGSGSMLGLCFGGQYIGWNLEGGLALWHSGLATASVKLVPVETRHVDLEFEVGGGIGFDGYDADMQLAGGVTARGGLTVKF